MKSRKLIVGLIKFAVAVGLIGFLFHKGLLNVDELKELIHVGPILVGAALAGLTIVIQGFRWRALLECQGVQISFFESFRLCLIGLFFNFALPGSIGGDVVRGYYIAQRNPDRKIQGILAVVLDRVVGLYAMIVISLMAILFNLSFVLKDARLQSFSFATFLVFLAMSIFALAAFSMRIALLLRVEWVLGRLPFSQKWLSMFKGLQNYRGHRQVLVSTFFMSLISTFGSIVFMMMVGWWTDQPVSVGTYFFAVPLGFIAASLPIAPAGLGVGQIAFLVLFQIFSGKETAVGQTGITAFQVLLVGWALVGAFFYIQRPKDMTVQ